MLVESVCLLVGLIGRLGRRRVGVVGVLNEVPAVVEQELGSSAVGLFRRHSVPAPPRLDVRQLGCHARLSAFRRRPVSAPPRLDVGQLDCHAQLGVFRRRPVSALSPPRPGLFRRLSPRLFL